MKQLMLPTLSWWPAVAGCLLLVVWVYLKRSPGSCGKRRGWWPTRWIWASRCGYDLRGLPEHDGCVTCPECGGRTPTRRVGVPGKRRGGRLIALACVAMIMLGLSVPAIRPIRSGRWVRMLPDLALVRLREWLGSYAPGVVRMELIDRAWRQVPDVRALDPKYRAEIVALVVDELRDDDIVGNADEAISLLDGRLRAVSGAALRAALTSDDWQQRQLAGQVLRRREERPSPQLIAVCVEALRDDPLPSGPDRRGTYRYTFVNNASSSLGYLVRHPDESAGALSAALSSDDWQQRLLAAVAVALTSAPGLQDRAAVILVEHLGDNAIDEDAKWATAGLVAMGPRALAELLPAMNDEDEQRAYLSRRLVNELVMPGCGDRLAKFAPRRHVTDVVDDPLRLNVWSLEMPRASSIVRGY